MVLRLSLYSSQSLWWYSDYPYTHHSESSCWSSVYPYPHHILFGGTQTNPIPITVSLVVPKISLYSSQSAWWFSDYPYTHHSLPGDTQTILVFITAALVVLVLSLYSSQSLWCVLSLSLITSLSVLWYSEYPYTESHHSLHIGSDNPYTHHSLPRGTQTIPLLITVCLVVLGLSLYSSQSPWWYSDYHYTHHSLPGDTQTIPVFFTAALAVLRLSLCTSQSPWWYS